jgi:hypothetical protein
LIAEKAEENKRNVTKSFISDALTCSKQRNTSSNGRYIKLAKYIQIPQNKFAFARIQDSILLITFLCFLGNQTNAQIKEKKKKKEAEMYNKAMVP